MIPAGSMPENTYSYIKFTLSYNFSKIEVLVKKNRIDPAESKSKFFTQIEITGWGEAGKFFEDPCKMTLIRKPVLIGDIR